MLDSLKRSELPENRLPVYLGIDPGKAGGMVMLTIGGNFVGGLSFGNSTDHQIGDWVRENHGRIRIAALEKVGGFIQGNPAPGSAMFNFGQSYGFIRGLLVAFGIPFLEPRPQVWQKRLAIPPKKDKTAAQHKKVLQGKAHERWPGSASKITQALSDAVLIAEWLRLEERVN